MSKMSEAFPLTTSELARLRYNLRCQTCELLTAWALKIAPKGYVPGMVEAAVSAYRREGVFAALDQSEGNR